MKCSKWQAENPDNQKFLDLCKDADPDIPGVNDTKMKLAGLKNK